jgi:hypothetical protein
VGAGPNNNILQAMAHVAQNFDTIAEDPAQLTSSGHGLGHHHHPTLQHQSSTLAGLSASSSAAVISQPAYQQPPAEYFSTESLMERMKQYAAQGGIPVDYIERYSQQQQQQQQHQGGGGF